MTSLISMFHVGQSSGVVDLSHTRNADISRCIVFLDSEHATSLIIGDLGTEHHGRLSIQHKWRLCGQHHRHRAELDFMQPYFRYRDSYAVGGPLVVMMMH